MTGHPRARSEGLICEEVDDELLVYDETTHTAHALSKDATAVWRRCDGHSSAKGIARRLGLEQARVSQALDELSASGLIEEPEGISRRALYKRTAKLGAAALSAPLIYSVAIRPANAAASGVCVPAGSSCVALWENSTCSGPKFSSNECGLTAVICDCQVEGPCVPFGPVWARGGTCPPVAGGRLSSVRPR